MFNTGAMAAPDPPGGRRVNSSVMGLTSGEVGRDGATIEMQSSFQYHSTNAPKSRTDIPAVRSVTPGGSEQGGQGRKRAKSRQSSKFLPSSAARFLRLRACLDFPSRHPATLIQSVCMSLEMLTFEARDRIGIITVNRPDKLNALNDATIAELGYAIDEARSRDDIGGIILTGAGSKAFVAGADIAELAEQGPVDGRERSLRGQRVFTRFETSPKPTVAAINGYALGGGCELALSCHIRIAAEGAKLGLPETRLGIGPGYGGTQRLPRLVGKGRALQLILTGEMIDAAEAYRIGLVNKVVPAQELLSSAKAMLLQILEKGPLAVAMCIEAVNRGLEGTLDDGLAIEANHFGLLASTTDMREGMRAFLEKRPAKFSGR